MRYDIIRMHTPTVEVRSTEDGTRVMHGYAAVFNEWTEINSRFEGHFLERISPGAFTKTIDESLPKIKVLYEHGMDPTLGNKPLGTIRSLVEDRHGLAYEVDLLPTDYNAGFIIPAVEAGTLGASFRFSVPRGKDDWDRETEPPKRTINEVQLMEFGPVTFPAYDGATAGVRSRAEYAFWRDLETDEDREKFAEILAKARRLDTPPEGEPSQPANEPAAEGHSNADRPKLSASERQRRLTIVKVRKPK